MNFFESQDIARRNTKLLLFLFFLAVLSLVVLTNLLVFALINFSDTARLSTGQFYYNLETFAAISLGVIVLIAIASLIRLAGLRSGGSAVAEMMDGELLIDAGGDLNKKKLLNVVEEMAIASGTPVPPVYLIRDQAINAFAAGYSPGDAVIGVTYGAIETLTRDELQGVVAHEFSHILNGDMRLNIRLMGVLYGILVLTVIGRVLTHSGAFRSRSRGKSDARLAIVGLGLMVVGYLGQFFGNLIKAGVSRQREYLADASAVQFTRNPQGIADALKRIGGSNTGTVLSHPESEELSHAFFCEGVTFSFSRVMATHPPLQKRIERIDPRWDGNYLEGPAPSPAGTGQAAPEGVMGFAAGATVVDADNVVENIGNPDESQIETARKILGALPEALTAAAREPYSARALVYLMHLDDDEEIRTAQLQHLIEAADFGVYDSLSKLIVKDEPLEPGMRLPLLEIAIPTLRQLSYEQYKLFLANLDVLIRADGRIGLSEWARQKMITKHLGEAFEARHTTARHSSLKAVKDECQTLLSLLAHADRKSKVSPDVAFNAGAQGLGLDINLLERKQLGFKAMNTALDNLAALHPLKKPKLLKACVRTVSADNVISQVEEELLRTIADTLECPMPPISD